MRWQWMGWQIHQLKGRSCCGFKPQQKHNKLCCQTVLGVSLNCLPWCLPHPCTWRRWFPTAWSLQLPPPAGLNRLQAGASSWSIKKSGVVMNVGRISITEKVGYQYSWSLVTRNTSTSRVLKKPQELNKRNTYKGPLYRHTGKFDSATCW